MIGLLIGLPVGAVQVLTFPRAYANSPFGAIAVNAVLLSAAVANLTWSSSRVLAVHDELHVRNWIRDEVFRRSDVFGFARVEMSGSPRRQGKARRGERSQIGVIVRGPRTILLNATVRGPIDTTSVDEWVSELNRWLGPLLP